MATLLLLAMVDLVALDLVVWLILAGAVHMSLLVTIPRVHLHDPAADASGFGVPGHVIADFESLFTKAIHT